jgi:hypothetical protein
MTRNTIVRPCIVKSWLNVCRLTTSAVSGVRSSVRISSAITPPSRKKTRLVQM